MPTDTELFKERHTELRHIPDDARAAEILAKRHGHEASSVRGRLSRASTPENLMWLAENIAKNPPSKSPSVQRQEELFKANRRKFARTLTRSNRTVVGLFDIHYPYTRWDAMNLAMQIIEDVRPDYVLHGGDMNDNEGRGKWDDHRTAYDSLFSADYSNQATGELAIFRAIKKVAPYALQPVTNGNHDLWRFNGLREETPYEAEDRIAGYVEKLSELDVLVMSSTREEALTLSPYFKAWHGQFTSPNHQSNARNTLGQFMEDGQAVSVVVGHTHRPIHIPGSSVGYSGVDYWNAPCLSRVERIPWLKRDPRAWGLGIYYAEMHDRGVRGENILFTEYKGKLTCKFNGRMYEAELKV